MYEEYWVRALTKLAQQAKPSTKPWYERESSRSLGSAERKKAAAYHKLLLKKKGGTKSYMKELKPGGVLKNKLMPYNIPLPKVKSAK